MASVLITGSTQGLGLGAARALLADGHDVVVHARDERRAEELDVDAAQVVVGDLASAGETDGVAEQVNAIGRMDGVIHNAGVYIEDRRIATPEGHARTLAVNVLAPYVLTARIERPSRLIYISSGMHRSGDASLRDIDWTARRWSGVQAYCDSKLFVVALALAFSRLWPEVCSNAVTPGWVPTRMGGPGAPDDLELGHVTQAWLAVADQADSGGYWYHKQREAFAPAAADPSFQDALLGELAGLTGVDLTATAA